MDNKIVLLLGGYGYAGRYLASEILKQTTVRLILAGRNPGKAEQAAANLQADFGDRVTALAVDAYDEAGLRQACTGVDLVLVAAGVAADRVAAAALAAGCDGLDIIYSQQKLAALKTLEPRILEAGRCWITEAGLFPGLPSALVRYLAPEFDSLQQATVGCLINQNNLPLTQGFYEMVAEMAHFQSVDFQEGHWHQAGLTETREIHFGPQFGHRDCFPESLPELHPLPELFPSIRDLGFYAAGFNWFTDWLVFPLMLTALRFWPRGAVNPMARLLHWSLRTFSSPPFGSAIKIEAQGLKDGKPQRKDLLLTHPDAYLFTALAVVACLKQYLDGSIKRPGLHLMGHLVEPARLLEDLEAGGVEIAVGCVPRTE